MRKKSLFEKYGIRKMKEGEVHTICQYVSDPEANNGGYFSHSYCYADNCPGRTEKEPWPHDKGYRKGKKYYCAYCHKEMIPTFSGEDYA